MFSQDGRVASRTHAFVGGTATLTTGSGYYAASRIVSRARTNDSYVFAGPTAGRRYTVNGLNQYTAAGPPRSPATPKAT